MDEYEGNDTVRAIAGKQAAAAVRAAGDARATDADDAEAAAKLTALGGGVFAAPGARIIDRSGRRRMPIGWADFAVAMRSGVLVDKTMLIADVLDRSYAATLFCRPRRFGKTLNMTMMKAYLESPDAGGLPADEARAAFEHTEVWDADGGRYREYQGAYPVVHLSFSTAKQGEWNQAYDRLKSLIADEYRHHAYLREEGTPLLPEDVAYLDRIMSGTAADADFAGSLAALCRMLYTYHGTGAVVLIDEYDAPVMAGYSNGYYDQVVGFLKSWLTGELKDGGPTLAFACLTGVQRISKESIFSDLNNLYVSTALNTRFDERYGFTDAEVAALLAYMGRPECLPEAREWYDGYRFGNADVYNPWSVASYIDEDCRPAAYWVNTSDNIAVRRAVANADERTLGDIYALLERGGTVLGRLNLGLVFPDLDARRDALWSMLYLSGYLTTDDVADPTDRMMRRRLRVPDREVASVFRDEVMGRFLSVAGGDDRLDSLHDALVSGDAEGFEHELGRIALNASSFDLTGENACHMLVMGLLFGVPGYLDPVSNREAGRGRFDIQLRPDPKGASVPAAAPRRPLVTVELKFLRPADAPEGADAPNGGAGRGAAAGRAAAPERAGRPTAPDAAAAGADTPEGAAGPNGGAGRAAVPEGAGTLDAALRGLAEEGLRQIASRGYDQAAPAADTADGRLRWGVAFSGKHVAAACQWA